MLNKVISDYRNKKRALLAFNVQNIIQIETLKECSMKLRMPVIVQFSSKYISFLDEKYGIVNLVKKYKSDTFFFHLDHCKDEKTILYCINSGFDSVMFDGSSLDIEENIELTNKYYSYAFKKGCLIEAEIGEIKGVEDGFGTDDGGVYSASDLKAFSINANFDLLALAIGNAHGTYPDLGVIKIELLNEAQKIAGSLNLVLHGGTGMTFEMLRKSIEFGVVKINISTALKIETSKMIKEYSHLNEQFDEINFNKFATNFLSKFFTEMLIKFN